MKIFMFFIIQALGDAKINIFFVFSNSTRSDDGNNIVKLNIR